MWGKDSVGKGKGRRGKLAKRKADRAKSNERAGRRLGISTAETERYNRRASKVRSKGRTGGRVWITTGGKIREAS